MTCNGCRAHVEKTLQEVDGVKNATVDLEKAEAVIEMDQHIPWDILETALQKGGGNYHISLPVLLKQTQTLPKFHKKIVRFLMIILPLMMKTLAKLRQA